MNYGFPVREVSMKGIDAVVVGTYKTDIWLANISIASIRYWYPDIPIYIYKDLYSGDYDTGDLESYWEVKVIRLERENRYSDS